MGCTYSLRHCEGPDLPGNKKERLTRNTDGIDGSLRESGGKENNTRRNARPGE